MTALEDMVRHPVGQSATPETLSFLIQNGEVRSFAAGQIAVREGNAHEHVLLLLGGQLELYRRNREAETQMLVGVMESPAVFGDAELFSRTPRWMVSGRALKGVTALCVPNAIFEEVIEQDIQLARMLYKDACARHMLVINIMQILALQKTQHKILRLLWSAAVLQPGGGRRAPFSQVRLAKALGVDRKTVGRNIRSLEADGYLHREGDDVILTLSEEMAFLAKLGKHGMGASWKLAESDTAEPDAEEASSASG